MGRYTMTIQNQTEEELDIGFFAQGCAGVPPHSTRTGMCEHKTVRPNGHAVTYEFQHGTSGQYFSGRSDFEENHWPWGDQRQTSGSSAFDDYVCKMVDGKPVTEHVKGGHYPSDSDEE